MKGKPGMTKVMYIGSPSTIPGWPSNDIEGLFDALSRWTLHPDCDFSEEPPVVPMAWHSPFKCPAWCEARYFNRTVDGCERRYYMGTKPIYPDHPDAVAYSGNFLGYSFAFSLHTDDEGLIARLDSAIAENMRSPEYQRYIKQRLRRHA